MFYEFRTYTCTPNKLPVVLNRFKTTTLGLFEKHGFKMQGPIYTTAIGDDNLQLKYLLQWESHDARDKAWGAFRLDPDWAKALVESEKDGPTVAKITNEILAAVPFSVK
jgi:hypothetical protein